MALIFGVACGDDGQRQMVAQSSPKPDVTSKPSLSRERKHTSSGWPTATPTATPEPATTTPALTPREPRQFFDMPQLRQWEEQLAEDIYTNFKETLIEDYGVPGLMPISGIESMRIRRVVDVRVTCHIHLSEIETFVRQRLSALNIPQEAVEVKAIPGIFCSGCWGALGISYQERCSPHPAGFGGWYLSRDNPDIVYVYLLHPTQKAAEEVMRYTPIGDNHYGAAKEIHPLQGKYTYIELDRWNERFGEGLYNEESPHPILTTRGRGRAGNPGDCFPWPSLLTIEPDFDSNRLGMTINRHADIELVRQAVEERLIELDIPREAVVIALSQPPDEPCERFIEQEDWEFYDPNPFRR